VNNDKIITHTLGNGWFTVSINGVPLIGDKGGYSQFSSRKEAKIAAQDRLKELTADEKKQLGI
jgi:hypothetical protein